MTHAQTVRLALEDDIFAGRLAPGASLDEEALARRFSVSRTPVREAMLQLIQSGLVEKRPRQGAIVAQIDLSDMIRLFEVMSELEGICAKFAARRMTPQERTDLRKLHEASEAAFKAGREDEYYHLSRKFHLMVIEGTHNHELIETTNRLGIKLVPYRRFQLSYPGRSENNLRDHEKIMEAICGGEYELAAELFRKHTNVQGDVLAEYIALGDREALRANAAG
ncbi:MULTISPECIES: GntR family transcriptional regulator [unclassified Roseivivax]|uniref:GntR family transcriptional regulator n=1 Tax=Roseivivax sp. GX 12232 TaxID=2900547 RepID=UPI001E3A55D5|nr:GntR family transcriptional regulator [Roseivivax sp. GX 12232]MCE0506180.1 GntR family transcriptional regulator [Roseivivax sp. GX 12232]